MNTSLLPDDYTDNVRSVARRLTYNEDTPQAQAKFLLLEMSSKLDQLDIRVHKKSHGRLIVINGAGQIRPLTVKEQFLYRVFGVTPSRI